MCIRLILLTLFITGFSISINADVLKWVDDNGKTHYSNKENKSSRNKAKIIKFVEYETPVDTISQTIDKSKSKETFDVDSFTDVSIDQGFDVPEENRIILKDLNQTKSYTQRKSRNTQRNSKPRLELTIAEYNQRCEDAREELIAPLRQEAILVCMKMKNSMKTRTRDYCEGVNDNFGDGGMNSRGFYIQRMFHNIPECLEAYEAWDRRSRRMRGYSEE